MEVLSLLVVLFSAQTGVVKGLLTSLGLGSSLSVEKESDFLISPNKTFTSGFYKVGTNAYCYSIWFTNSANKTVVWMANRDSPVNGKRSNLSLNRNGNLVLTDAEGSVVWSTNTFSEGYVEVQLLETGNLVLINQGKNVIWESFDFPTDTLLPSQPLVRNTTMVSMKSPGTYSSGYYNLKFDDNNVLDLLYNGLLVSSVYWPNTAETVFFFGRTPYNSSRVAFLNDLGGFTSSDNLSFNSSDYGFGPRRRLTLDYDGMLRLYSLEESTGLWEISWLPPGVDACMVHGLCGPFGVCSYSPLPTCSCPHGFYRNDPMDWFKGCSPRFNLTCNQTDQFDFVTLPNTNYFGYDLSHGGSGMSFEACRSACLKDCRCQGFGYSFDGQGQCNPKRTLLNGYNTPDSGENVYIKVPTGIAISKAEQGQIETNALDCSGAEVVPTGDGSGVEDAKRNAYMKYLIPFVGLFGIIEMICVGLGWWFVHQNNVKEELVNMGYAVLAMGFKRFTFAELKRATHNFKQEIGKGGFGTVYRGVFDNQRVVAVKKLDGVSQGEAEFWAEVSIIGRLNHRNLVKMWGFCAEGEHKLLVYDYVENGSLDKILFSDSSGTLGLVQRYKIARGTAKGLSYIHEQCLEWVLHCDVKPQNILLDDQLEPKVTDFGMSKLFKDTTLEVGFSKVRGTRGYLAPEWMMNLNINAKADVYSYGIVLLELLTGKRASGFQKSAGHENEYNHLLQWVREKIAQGRLVEVIDPILMNQDAEKVQRLLRVALMCVEEDRDTRPAMSEVVELLTGCDESCEDVQISTD